MKLNEALEEFAAVHDALVSYLSTAKQHDDFFAIKPYVCIAGGFIRDRLLGREPKDIDVVVDTQYNGVDWVEQKGAKYDHGGVKYLGSVPEDVGDIADYPLEFIIRKTSATPMSIVQYHSCTLSNVFFDQEGLHVHPSFIKAVTNRVVGPSTTWAVDRCEREGERKHINTYLKRVHKKYPDFRLELL